MRLFEYHLVDNSPWPILAAFSSLIPTIGGVVYMKRRQYGLLILYMGLLGLILSAYLWFRDIVREGTYQGHHTNKVKNGLRIGIILFIVSEVMFFSGFFWAYFHSSLTPPIDIGCIWPPKGIIPLNTWGIPLLNTIILLSSGATVTWAHWAIISDRRSEGILALFLTILLAVIFTYFQVIEYFESSFTIADSVYGSTFFMATGFHGFHVIIGTIFLTVGLIRLVEYHYTTTHHFGFEAAAWYRHLVDIVWLFLFISIYYWGS